MVGKTMRGVKSHGLMMYLLWNCSVVICLDSSGFAGINPADRQYYETDVIMCKDGSNHFTRARLNDDFCDCTDGTDEPGTSACAEGHFFCLNAHRGPTKIYSSQVNDGICDCCDGSDEHYFKVRCQNTCGKEENAFTEKLMQDMTKSVIIDVPTNNEMKIEDIRQEPRDLKGIAILEVVGIAFVLVCYWYYHKKRTYFRQRLSTSHPSTKSV